MPEFVFTSDIVDIVAVTIIRLFDDIGMIVQLS